MSLWHLIFVKNEVYQNDHVDAKKIKLHLSYLFQVVGVELALRSVAKYSFEAIQ